MTHRHFEGLGIAKTVVTTDAGPGGVRLNSSAYRIYEVPVGFGISVPL